MNIKLQILLNTQHVKEINPFGRPVWFSSSARLGVRTNNSRQREVTRLNEINYSSYYNLSWFKCRDHLQLHHRQVDNYNIAWCCANCSFWFTVSPLLSHQFMRTFKRYFKNGRPARVFINQFLWADSLGS